MTYKLPKLPYDVEACAPIMSKETFDYHYGKHFQAYINNLNALIAGTPFENMPLEEIIQKSDGGIFNNAAQTWNHDFFFNLITPNPTAMPESLKSALSTNFSSVEKFKEEFTNAALKLFGSGWVWLAADKNGKLSIISTSNADTPVAKGMKPILTIDVWEHAYYIDYRNNRKAYIEGFWKLIDWGKVEHFRTK